jgi:hypothetical protein
LASIRRLTAHLSDPKTPIDAIYVSAFRELASRCGLPAMTAQSVESFGISATITKEDISVMARRIVSEVIVEEQIEDGC